MFVFFCSPLYIRKCIFLCHSKVGVSFFANIYHEARRTVKYAFFGNISAFFCGRRGFNSRSVVPLIQLVTLCWVVGGKRLLTKGRITSCMSDTRDLEAFIHGHFSKINCYLVLGVKVGTG